LAINPPSDIVLDVARAADPLKLQAAALKLTGASDTDEGSGFSSMVDGFGQPAHTGPAVISAPGLIGLQSDFGPKGPQLDKSGALSGPAMKPYRDFEAFVLQSFVQSMLPNEAEGVFGRGTAGEMWKGLLAEQLGKQLARSGGIGIAASVLKAHPGAAKGRGLAGQIVGSAAPRGFLPLSPLRSAIAPPQAGARIAAISPLHIDPAGGGTTSKRTP
jgi:flagellar protein FlgJ